ncbi:class I SAM-dependent methyltransferase [Acidocella sp.]|uniref:class I SAM-dependent methyltransferase n=1 Tax=Acidocella sp. TaxID=50710 RepID=UPI002631AE48|nr:class I SAM-dependent methyltransferase [Acidocella sp.]
MFFDDTAMAPRDIWFEWLNHGRFGRDERLRARVEAETARLAGRLLDHVPLPAGGALVDVGCGAGLVGLTALALQPDLKVTFCDVSGPLLAQARARAPGGRFLEVPATALAGVADASQDVAAARAVLAYVADKGRAFDEMLRVLRPGGWMTLAEPVWRDEALAVPAMAAVAISRGDALARARHKWKQAQFSGEAMAALTGYSERDLLMLARAAGFGEVHVRLEIDVEASPAMSWAAFCALMPHPLAPSLKEIALSAEERAALEAALRPHVEAGTNWRTRRVAYVWAQKPA